MEESETPFEIGKSYFFRAVTYHIVGRVTEKTGRFLKLEDASWIADSGRFMQFLEKGKANEVEPVGIAYINTESIVDAFPWEHALPKEQK